MPTCCSPDIAEKNLTPLREQQLAEVTRNAWVIVVGQAAAGIDWSAMAAKPARCGRS